MGADNLRSFHRWQKWRAIADLVPIAVVDRVGPSLYATAGTAGQALARFRIPERGRALAARRKPPAWVFLHGLKSPLSSTARVTGGNAAEKCHIKVAEPQEIGAGGTARMVESVNRPRISLS